MSERPANEARRAWWREGPFWLVVALVAVVYGSRISTLTIRGEEPRRAQVALEMIERGDWIVPRQQGAVFADRPPLQNWVLAGGMLLTGRRDAALLRWHSVAATLATCVIVYAYGRQFLGTVGATAAAAGLATMGQVLELGRLAETEALFMFWVTAALLVWHGLYERRGATALAWSAGYALAALAGLTKGPQGPIYFCAAAGLYLLVRRDWWGLFRPAHALGLGVFALMVGLWQIPYASQVTSAESREIWFRLASNRFDYSRPGEFVRHLLGFPWEIVGCMLPWSLVLLAAAPRLVRERGGPATRYAVFLAGALGVSFPTVWFAPNALTRYYLPLYPCAALLMGWAVERSLAAAPDSVLGRVWTRYAAGFGVGMMAAAAACVVISIARVSELFSTAIPPWLAWGYALLAAPLGWFVWNARRAASTRAAVSGVLGIAAFMGLTYAGPVTNLVAARSLDIAPAVAALRDRLPEGARLVSFDHAHSLLAWYYGEPIELRAWPQSPAEGEDVEYFCFAQYGDRERELPFAWEEVARVSCDRAQRETPRDKMIFGRRLPAGELAAGARNAEAR